MPAPRYFHPDGPLALYFSCVIFFSRLFGRKPGIMFASGECPFLIGYRPKAKRYISEWILISIKEKFFLAEGDLVYLVIKLESKTTGI